MQNSCWWPSCVSNSHFSLNIEVTAKINVSLQLLRARLLQEHKEECDFHSLVEQAAQAQRKKYSSQHLQASVSMLEVKVHDMTVRKETEWVWLVWRGFRRKIYQWICKELGKKSDWRRFIWKASSVLRPNSGEFKILHRMSQGVWWGTRSIVGQRPSYGTTPTRT